jgi:hypothetical protein
VNSLIVGVAIGLVFSFAVLAAVTSIITEGVARYLGLRAEYLLRGLRTMLDGGGEFRIWPFPEKQRMGETPRAAATAMNTARPVMVNPAAQTATLEAPTATPTVMTNPDEATVWPWVSLVMSHPLIAPSTSGGDVIERAGDRPLTRKERRKLPSYISSRSFAEAIIDLLVPDAEGTTSLSKVRAGVEALPESDFLRKPLLSLLKSAGDDLDAFRSQLETWYDDQMARVSGWYKRHVRGISLAVGLILVLAFNVNALSIGRALYSDEALRGAVVTEAAQASDCSGDAAACLKKIEDQIAEAKALGLPLGWTPIARCATADDCSAWDAYGLADPDHNGAADVFFFLTVLLGFALMVLSLVPGARFWFDLLGRLGSLRSTGPRPTPST